MSVVFDASILIDLFSKRLSIDRKARLDHLVDSLKKRRTKVMIPTPALAEFLVKAGSARGAYLQELSDSAAFTIESFDQRAAVECALLLEEAWASEQKRKVNHTKFKFDWQIVAIAASRRATAIYSDDSDIAKAASRVNIPVYSINALPIPSSAQQID